MPYINLYKHTAEMLNGTECEITACGPDADVAKRLSGYQDKQ